MNTINAEMTAVTKIQDQAALLYNRLVKRWKHLRKWARRVEIEAFRLYDRDIPEIPLVLDLYGSAISGALYQRPYEKDEAQEALWLSAMKAAISRALAIAEDHVYLKERRRMRRRQEQGTQYGKLRQQRFYCDVREGDMVFRVNLSDYLDTGLFLDARKKRGLIRGEAKGKRVLNLFAYTCTLSVAAARGGAAQVDSVDLSNTYLEWGKVNFALNGLGLSSGKSSAEQVNFIREDVIRFVRESAGKRLYWDLIILDPPSFSNSKKMRVSLDLKRDHRELVKNCLSLLSPEGVLYFSANAKGFVLDRADFPGFAVENISPSLVDEDFAGKKIPVCYRLRKTGASGGIR